MATRQLVCTLSENLPTTYIRSLSLGVLLLIDIIRVPILALVDADPYGIDILSVYKYGSQRMSHENERLVAPNVRWLGLFGSEIAG